MNDKQPPAIPVYTRPTKSTAYTPPPTVTPAPVPAVARDWNKILLCAALIIAAGLFVAAPAFHGTWLWDDDQEITANPALSSGLAGLKMIWQGNVGADYLPLKTTIIWIEWQIWQYDNTCYHMINAIFHVMNALLIWNLFYRLKIKWAWVGGLLFAIHPILVESVAWVSEQKNTISLIFMLLSAITYINFHERGKTGSLIASLLLFVAALLSKSAVIMLPFCFVLYGWWRDNKFEFKDILAGGAVAALMVAVLGIGMAYSKVEAFYLIKYTLTGAVGAGVLYYLWWISKGENWPYVQRFVCTMIPYFTIMTLIAVVTVHFQHKNAIGAEIIPVGGYASRTVIAGFATFFYLFKCIVPFELIPIYPRWVVPDSPPLWMYLPWVGFAALVYLFWMFRNTWGRHMILGLGFFFGFLVPVLGFITMSYMRITWVADHFVYISVIGVIGLVVAGAAKIYDLLPSAKRDSSSQSSFSIFSMWSPQAWWKGVCIACLVFLAWEAHLFSDVYLNETNMWRYTLSKNPNAWQAHSRYGKVLLDSGNQDAAFYHIQQSNRLRPDLAETNNNMGVLLLQKKRGPEALPYFKKSVELMPIGAFLVNYANALTQAGQGGEAAPYYEKLLFGDPAKNIGGDPNNPIILTNYGVALMQANRREDASRAFTRALQINPNLNDARRNLEILQGNPQPATPPQPPPLQQSVTVPISNVPTGTGVAMPPIPSIFLNK